MLQVSCDRNFQVQRLGLRWQLNPSDFVESFFYWTAEFEPWNWYHLSRIITPGSIVCDIGANFGFYTVMIARQLQGTGGRVFAFEPCKETFERLETNVRLNNLRSVATVLSTALSDRQGVGFLEQEQNQILSAARSATRNSGARFVSHRGEPIALETLDNIYRQGAMQRLDVIKIDVEGHELAVLNGATEVIEQFRPALMIEFNPAALNRAGASARELDEKLRSWGYGLFEPKRKALVPFTNLPVGGTVVNILALLDSPAH
jgi:FkbM family methyltransferase